MINIRIGSHDYHRWFTDVKIFTKLSKLLTVNYLPMKNDLSC